MKCGSADHVLDKLKQVLGDVASARIGNGKEQIAEKILKGITNTMSECCIVQKKFNKLLQEYRAEVLRSDVGGWEDYGIGAAQQVDNDEQLFLRTPLYIRISMPSPRVPE